MWENGSIATRRISVILAASLLVVIAAACSSGTAGKGSGPGSTAADNHDQALKFAQCMRANGVSQFPDPSASGTFTIENVINGSSLDPNSAPWKKAIGTCKDLEPAGFTGATRSPDQQKAALQFAQCMRENGVKDFPDPAPDGPIIDTSRMPGAPSASSIPGFRAAMQKCGAMYGAAMGVKGQ